MTDNEIRNELLKGLEAMRDAVAAFTGMKQQFIDAGWSPVNAEAMVVEIYRQNTKETR